jgi:hypothetical protein
MADHSIELTLTGVNPGISRVSRVSHTEWIRGWLAEPSASALLTLLRWDDVMNAAPAVLADLTSCKPE